MMKKPRLLILDEVCAGLDPIARKKYLDSLRQLIRRERHISVLFVTHHIEEIFPEMSHVLGLNRGHVVFSGKKEVNLTQENMVSLFGKNVRLRKASQTYYLDVF